MHCESTSQEKTEPLKVKEEHRDFDPYFTESTAITTNEGPGTITRNIFQDRDGNIWLATWKGIMQYDGDQFINHTNKEGLRRHRIFTIMQDKRGGIWFGSIGAGLYHFDGESFTNITTSNGLANDRVHCLYEDSAGRIWVGTNGGISIYDPTTTTFGDSTMFDNLGMDEGLTNVDVNSIVEHKGQFWIGTRGRMFAYDGNKFSTVERPSGDFFRNVRRVIKDSKGAIWMGGNSGLWQYADGEFTQWAKAFHGYIHEDRDGNIWTSSESLEDRQVWVITKYTYSPMPVNSYKATEVLRQENMFFDIMEDNDGNIWVGKLDGTCRISAAEVECFD